MFNPKTKAKLPEVPLIRRLSTKALQRGIYVLAFALIGTTALYFTSAAEAPSVRFVLFCATDTCNGTVTKADMQEGAVAVQAWYKSEVGRTFSISSYSTFQGKHNKAWYNTNTSNAKAINWDTADAGDLILTNMAADMGAPVYGASPIKTVILQGWTGLIGTHCGLAAIDGDFAVAGSNIDGCKNRATIAHELGHAFGLQHVKSLTLMYPRELGCDNATRLCNLPEVHIDPSQVNPLLASPWFPAPPGTGPYRLAAGDVNADGIADIVGVTTGGALKLYLSSGSTTHPYSASTTIGASGWNSFNRLLLGNVTADKKADIIATKPDGSMWLYPNTADVSRPYSGGFEIGTSGWNGFSKVMLGDVTGDGFADIVAVKSTDGSLWLYTNNGDQSHPFSAGTQIGASGWNGFNTLTLTNVNASGGADLVASKSDGSLLLYANTGTASRPFSAGTQIGASGWNGFELVMGGNLNTDKNAELIAVRPDGTMFDYINTGSSARPFGSGTQIGSGWQIFRAQQ